MAKMLTADEILGVKLRGEVVDMTPHGWSGSVVVRQMSSMEQAEFLYLYGLRVENLSKDTGDPKDMRGMSEWMACRCIVDESGARLFENDAIEDLGALSYAALQEVSNVVNRLTFETGEADGVEEAGKNSEAPAA